MSGWAETDQQRRIACQAHIAELEAEVERLKQSLAVGRDAWLRADNRGQAVQARVQHLEVAIRDYREARKEPTTLAIEVKARQDMFAALDPPNPQEKKSKAEQVEEALAEGLPQPDSASPDAPSPDLSTAERALVDELQTQIDAYQDSTAGHPRPVARWLRLLADKLDPDYPDDYFAQEIPERVQNASDDGLAHD